MATKISQKAKFPVLRMTCASCALSVESILKSQPGVVTASVNFASASVNVEYFTDIISEEGLRKAVQLIGYDLYIENNSAKQPSLEEIRLNNFLDLKNRTIKASALSLPVVVIGMFFMNMPYANLIMWALSTPVVIWFGRFFFINAWRQTKQLSANMDTLVALSTGIAYLFSVFNTLFPQIWLQKGLHAHIYFEASAVIISFILLGKLLEEKAKSNTSSAIKKLIGLQPKNVTIIGDNGQQIVTPIEKIQIGDTILVKPGEKIAVDGHIISGSSYIDESLLTGEPIPSLKKENDKVFAGTINQKGSFQFMAIKVGSETILAQIIKTVQQAQDSKAPVQKLVDKIAKIFVPVVIITALVSFAIWMISGGENAITHAILSLITVLVIACPCALGLATPTAIMVGIGKGAENGILIKDAESLELAKNVNAIVLDKTGTITEGKPDVTNILWLNNNDELKSVLINLEMLSQHPLAEAIVRHFPETVAIPLSHFKNITGKGIKANYKDQTYFVGNYQFMIENKITNNQQLIDNALLWGNQSNTVIWFANQNESLAVIAIADKIKGSSTKAIQQLHNLGIEVYMLTGDNNNTAKHIAMLTGIKQYKAEVMPHQKAEFIKELQNKGMTVAMVGDGINDSSALAQADVGIAMGKGSDIAMDVAKMTIISSDLSKIAQALNLSKQTVSTIKENLFWSFIYNIIGIPIAAGILYPFNEFLLNPMIAGAAMAMSSVSVVSNSLRLKWKKSIETTTPFESKTSEGNIILPLNKTVKSSENMTLKNIIPQHNPGLQRLLTPVTEKGSLSSMSVLSESELNTEIKKGSLIIYQFKTNINCAGCIAKISPYLNSKNNIDKWSVDITNENKILTVHSYGITKEEIIKIVLQAGFKIESYISK